MKMCIECKKFKNEDLDNFPLNRKRSDGSVILRTRCKHCYNEYRKNYKCRDVEKTKETRHRYYILHKDKIKKRSSDRYYKMKKEDEINILKDFYEKEKEKIEKMYE